MDRAATERAEKARLRLNPPISGTKAFGLQSLHQTKAQKATQRAGASTKTPPVSSVKPAMGGEGRSPLGEIYSRPTVTSAAAI